ncbi:MAG: hypothetical protein LUG50_13320 [Planctomycetaceae bacterium]|nr:hypothetical protein [Planctomycetaceae bacterium]
MVKRYSVSVSDELANKIDKWKKSINVSQVFQEAMERVIADKEGYTSRLTDYDDSIESIVERLRREKSLEDQTYYNQGKEVGFEWARKASYREIQMAISKKAEVDKNRDKSSGLKKGSLKIGPFKEIISKILQDTAEWQTIQWKFKSESGLLPAEAIQWLRGWLDGVDTLWIQVADKI